MKKVCWLLAASLICLHALAQKRDKKLQREVEEAIKGFNGDIGVYIKNLENGRTIAINADTIFPTYW